MMGDRMGGWTFRQGRTYVHDKSVRDTWCFNRVLLPILAALVLVGVPVGLIAAEQYYESLSLAFAEIDGSVVLSGERERDVLAPLRNPRSSPLHSSESTPHGRLPHSTICMPDLWLVITIAVGIIIRTAAL